MTRPLTPSQKGQKARKASPWNRAAHCQTKGAALSYARYRKRGKA